MGGCGLRGSREAASWAGGWRAAGRRRRRTSSKGWSWDGRRIVGWAGTGCQSRPLLTRSRSSPGHRASAAADGDGFISTTAPFGSAATANVERAGGGSGMYRPVDPLTVAKSSMSVRKMVVLTTSAKPDPPLEHRAEFFRARSACASMPPSTRLPVAGRDRSGRSRTRGRRRRSPGCTGRRRRARPLVVIAWRVIGHSLQQRTGRAHGTIVAVTNGSPSRVARSSPQPIAARTASPRPPRPSSAKDRAPRGGPGARRPHRRPVDTAAARDGTARGSGAPRPRRAGGVRRGEDRRPHEEVIGRSARSAARRRGAPTPAATAPPRPRMPAAYGRGTRSDVGSGTAGVTSNSPGTAPPGTDPRQRRPRARRVLPRAPDRPRGRTGRRTPGPRPWRGAHRPVELRAPRLERRRRVPRPHRWGAARPGPPPRGSACRTRAASGGGGPTPPTPAPTARLDGRGRAQDQVVVERTGVEPVPVEQIPRGGRRDRDRQPIRERQRNHHRVQLVEPVVPAADDRERQIELRRSQPDHRCQAPERVLGHGRGCGSGPSASSNRIHSPTARVCGRRSDVMATSSSARSMRSVRPPSAVAAARSAASSAARGSPPGRAATGRLPSRARGGPARRTAPARSPPTRPAAPARRPRAARGRRSGRARGTGRTR